MEYRRPASSKSERSMIKDFIKPVGAKADQQGNYILDVGDNPTVLWSCHTDTVHKNGGMQSVLVDPNRQEIFTGDTLSNCLGADDSAGVWLMLQMIHARMPGRYVFHRKEEIGGLGSAYIAKSTPAVLDGINHAIAFDRADRTSIITHQWGGRCCSDAFAKEMASQLKMKYRPDATGTFTDTANYTDLVPECTNISVGYFEAHSPVEYVDYDHLDRLLDALLYLEIPKLPVERIPGTDDDWDKWDYGYADYGTDIFKLEKLCREFPCVAAEMLDDMGVSADDFAEYVQREAIRLTA